MQGSFSKQLWVLLWVLLGACLLSGLTGCQTWSNYFGKSSSKSPKETDSMVIQAGATSEASAGETSPEMQAAEEAYRSENFAQAEKLFHRIAKDKHNSPFLVEKALFYEAESLRRQDWYPKAADTYSKLVSDFPTGVYRQEACSRMFEIANYWLEDTFAQLELEQEKRDGKRWFVPSNLVHWNRRKPLVDEEGRGLELMEKVHIYDPQGPNSDTALYIAGYIHFNRRNFSEADQLLSQMVSMFPQSKLRAKALELAIMAKNNATGGPDYDGRKAAEALKLVYGARASTPELANRTDFLDRQMVAIRYQQADKDIGVADFYRKRGRAGSAYYYYEIVRKRYPGTEHARIAEQRMGELRTELELSKDDGFWNQARRGFNEYVLGIDQPTLKEGQSVPNPTSQLPEIRQTNSTQPTSNPRSLPTEMLPRQ
jgi:outer membrane protein assembly factor BamD (BamD/ComL family)